MSTSLTAAGAAKMPVRNPSFIGRLFAVAGLAFGALSILTALLSGEGRAFLAFTLLGLGCLAPSAWWFYCTHKDRAKVKDYESALAINAALEPLLGEGDDVIRQGMAMLTPPERTERRWPLVGGISAAAAVVGLFVVPPAPQPDPAAVAATTTAVPASTAAPATTVVTTVPATTTAKQAATTRSEAPLPTTSIAPAPAPVEDEAPADLQPDTQPQGLMAPAPAPAPVPAQAPKQSASYANCTAVWNAIGGPIYQGQPGYDSHLDRDGDGVGCEKDPR